MRRLSPVTGRIRKMANSWLTDLFSSGTGEANLAGLIGGGTTAAGGGLGGILGPIGLGLSAAGSLTNLITGLIMSGRQSQQSHMDQRRWERMRAPVGEAYRSTFYVPGLNPYAPYGDWGKDAYQWAPNQAMEQMYSNYLNRTYGVPTNVAQAQVSQALQPTRIGRLPNQAQSPMALQSTLGQSQSYQPGVAAQSMLGTKVPALTSQLDYLKNAAELSAFNLWRAQQLPHLIG